MRILLVGAGGVGTAFARIAARRPFAELVIADDLGRAQRAAAARDGHQAIQLDARDVPAVVGLLRQHRCDALMNAADPRFVMPLFRAALQAGTHYLDMAMSLSCPHPEDPYHQTGVKLGDEQFALAPEWERSGKLALAGIGVEPGLSDVFARYAGDELFSEVAELGVRDGSNLEVAGCDFAPTFSIWTTIEECLNPPVIWERGRGWFTTEPFSEPEIFTFPAGIGPVECVNVEHEEVLLMPGGSTRSGSPSSTASARSSSACCGACTSSAWTRRSRCRSARRACHRVTWWRLACPTLLRWETR